ncbi:MAG: TIGR00159 family protein [Alphaproteobacteria bacterium]|nr:TIGR00159 family protein [Alphaproteobacteria bacterium]
MREWWDWLATSPLGTASVIDWVDVGLLAAAVYMVLRVLRGTRAFQSLIGLLLLGFVYLLSSALGLTTLHWVLDNLFVYAVLALIILFQEDIRRVLAQAGGTVFVGSTNPQGLTDANLVEEVIKAVFALASRRIGALVALQRNAELEPFCEGAHPLDAIVTTELLQALFHPTSPVHDGAVVIRHGRIAKAGVFLPISLSKGLPKVYGTRHRAAIGLTERTDAVCLLVSEERGTVAVVTDGKVDPVSDPNDLRQKLQEALGQVPHPAAEVAPA